MKHFYRIIQSLMLVGMCFVLLLAGCEKQPESKEDQKVISKEIVMSPKDTPAGEHGKKIKTSEIQKPDAKEAGIPEKKEVSPQTPIQKGEQALSMKEETQIAADAYMQPAGNQAAKPETAKTVPDPLIHPQSDFMPQPTLAIGENANKMAYIYNPVGKIDPFASIFKEKPEPAPEFNKEEKKKRAPMTPLEQISLDQLKLVAVMIAPSGDRALVEEASGKGYVITQGTFIGKNAGQVIDILMDRIILEEEVVDLFGKLVVKKTEMMLQKTPGE
ncbi:MAG: pilus assembly protein PilP [Desulfobacteraceae bacterium]|nr:pilus assembly protein PilP [Desulfobacteraceae bacterium]MBU4055837.1 pilus assembly protein PilP [Pseudomonadota bacterium]